MFWDSKTTRQNCSTQQGFSLIELLVSLAIITIITGIVLANHSRFSGTIFLSNLAYDVALSIRSAQVFGLSVQEYNSSFEVGYGVHFDETSTDSYFIFADIDQDQRYISSTDAIVEEYSITRGNSISYFCATPVGFGAVEVCSNDGASTMTTLDIAFNRPDPEAYITDNNGISYASARIILISRDLETRMVEVESTGQISVAQGGS